MEKPLAALASLLFSFFILLTVTTATATATTVESAESEVIASAEEWNIAALEILDLCYPISQILDEQSMFICDNAIAGIQYFCEFERTEQLTVDNTPSCNDPRIESYLDARK